MEGNVSACHVLTGVLSNVHVVCLSGCIHTRCCYQGEHMKLEITLPQRDVLMLQDLCSFLHMFVVVYVAALVFLDSI